MKKILLIVLIACAQVVHAQDVTLEKKYDGDTLYKVEYKPVLVGVAGVSAMTATNIYTSKAFPFIDTTEFNRSMKFPYGLLCNEKGIVLDVYTIVVPPTGPSQLVLMTHNETIQKDRIFNWWSFGKLVVVIIFALAFSTLVFYDWKKEMQKSIPSKFNAYWPFVFSLVCAPLLSGVISIVDIPLNVDSSTIIFYVTLSFILILIRSISLRKKYWKKKEVHM